jgi:hypothetical protein
LRQEQPGDAIALQPDLMSESTAGRAPDAVDRIFEPLPPT